MIKVIIGTNLNSVTVTVDPSKTLKEVMDENNVDYSRGGVHLDGFAIDRAGLNKSFAEHGVEDECMLITVVKGDGGRF